MSASLHVLLAHQGGWDEALFVAVPLVLFLGLLVVAKRRADAEAADEADEAAAAGRVAGEQPGNE